MWIFDGLVAGIIAGVFMSIVSEIGYRLELIKSHLVIVDSEYGLKMLKREQTTQAVYAGDNYTPCYQHRLRSWLLVGTGAGLVRQ
ncbi:hypothetical protein ACFLXN_02745 [Chloroflexota bacterium]